jgi:hypothetical protein
MADPYNVEAFEPFEVNGFLITGQIYFMAPTPPPPDPIECCRRTIRLALKIDGVMRPFVACFTDLDQAERFLDLRPDRGAGLNAIRCRNRQELLTLLTVFASLGDTTLGVDPGAQTHPRFLPIVDVIAAMQT